LTATSALTPPYIYRATVTRVIDGDTIVVDIDLGMYHHEVDVPIRLRCCAARELRDEGGPEARDNLATLLPPGTVVLLSTAKPDKYSRRWDASVLYADGDIVRNLSAALVATGWAVQWNGRGAQPKPSWPRVTEEQ